MLSLSSATINPNPPADTSSLACSTFRPSNVTNLEVVIATHYNAGDRVFLYNNQSLLNSTDLPAFCRLQLAVTTNETAGSIAHAEVWLPEPEQWNGRFMTIGNGGLSGGASLGDLGHVAIRQGFVGMSGDNGHISGTVDGSWAGPGNDNAIIDFAWRGMQLSILAAKEVIHQYYGKPQNTSYYYGCSTGGRQGLKQVQDFPENFDGAIIGSPANWVTHLGASFIRAERLTHPVNSSRWISADTWRDVIHPEVMNQCDELDGLRDGIINDPRKCSPDLTSIQCWEGQDPATCLTRPQITAVNQVYTDYYDDNGTYIFGGFYPGSERDLPVYLFGEKTVQFASEMYKYFVVNDTKWTTEDFTMDTFRLGDRINPGNGNAINPDLRPFAERPHSGKIIHYDGFAENLLSAANSIHYYETVRTFMQQHSNIAMDDFYRLFTVPGMAHCGGGYGANAFGGFGHSVGSGRPPLSLGPEHNIVAALVRWVEQGIAPETLTAASYHNNTVERGVAFTRPLCKMCPSLHSLSIGH